MIYGLDVSHHQQYPSKVPWKGKAFGCIRITWSDAGIDKMAEEHMQCAIGEGVELLIAYHYQKDNPGSKQAEHFHKRRLELEAEFGPLGCANDIEDMLDGTGKPIPWDIPKYQAATASFLGRHRELCRRPLLIYGNAHDIKRYAVGAHIEDEPLWLADWQAPYPAPPPWKKWTILQHKGGGLTGFDENRFEGTLEELRALLLPDTVAPPLSFDVLGSALRGVRAAEGRGGGPDEFVSRDEGPKIG